MVATGACLLLLLSAAEAGWRRQPRQVDCIPDSNLAECFERFDSGSPDDTFCTECRSLIEEYSRRCTSPVAPDIEEAFMILCDGASIPSTDPSCDPTSPLPVCVCIATELGHDEFFEGQEFCNNCTRELEAYINDCQVNCLNASTEELYRSIITSTCVEEYNPYGSCAEDDISPEVDVCLTRVGELEIALDEIDPNDFKSFCSDCQSNLEEFFGKCFDGLEQQYAKDSLDLVCVKPPGDANLGNEVPGDANPGNGGTGGATTVGATVFSTFSALVIVFVSALN